VTTNLCLNRIRDLRPQDVLEETSPVFQVFPGDPVERLEARRLVLDLLDQVDPKTGQIAVHSLLDEMSQEEIAEVMGMSRKTVGKRLTRFLTQARSRTGKGEGPP